jgi:hypothetical protein
MSRERYLSNFFSTSWIDDGKPAVAVAYHDGGCACIDANIVGVTAKINAAFSYRICAFKKLHGAVAGVRNIERVRISKYPTPCGSLRLGMVRIVRRAARSTTPTLSLPSSAT